MVIDGAAEASPRLGHVQPSGKTGDKDIKEGKLDKGNILKGAQLAALWSHVWIADAGAQTIGVGIRTRVADEGILALGSGLLRIVLPPRRRDYEDKTKAAGKKIEMSCLEHAQLCFENSESTTA